jgi:hypothetical protein
MVCEACGATAAQGIVKRTTKFTLFFIPLFPIKRPSYFRECTNCGVARHLEEHYALSVS